ncbi:MAG: hypothetical protein QXU69_08700 [Thermofilaceae archaeon]
MVGGAGGARGGGSEGGTLTLTAGAERAGSGSGTWRCGWSFSPGSRRRARVCVASRVDEPGMEGWGL